MNNKDIKVAINRLEMSNKSLKSMHEYDKADHVLLEKIMANELAIILLKKELNGGWIPVSERLPSYDCMCLVTDGENVFIANYDACLGWGSYKFNKKSITFRRTKYVTTAWQPLPEPYKEVENE